MFIFDRCLRSSINEPPVSDNGMFVPDGPTADDSSLIQVMAWYQ